MNKNRLHDAVVLSSTWRWTGETWKWMENQRDGNSSGIDIDSIVNVNDMAIGSFMQARKISRTAGRKKEDVSYVTVHQHRQPTRKFFNETLPLQPPVSSRRMKGLLYSTGLPVPDKYPSLLLLLLLFLSISVPFSTALAPGITDTIQITTLPYT